MKPKRDALGRFQPKLKHDPLRRFVILQEDGLAAFKTGIAEDAYDLAKRSGARLVMTRALGRHTALLAAAKPLRAVL